MHEYEIVSDNNKVVGYREYRENIEIIFYPLSQIDWNILEAAHERVLGLDDLQHILKDVNKESIFSSLQKLKNLGILYYYKEYQNIVTIIDTNCDRNTKQRYL